MLNRLFSALENTRSSISNAFKGLSGNNISDDNIGVLSGPNLSSEILMNKPATSLLSFKDIKKANYIRDNISNEIISAISAERVI